MENEIIEIDLLDLCKRLLSKWKQIFIVAIVLAILGNFFGVYSSNKKHESYNKFREKYNLTEKYYVDDVVENISKLIPDDNEYDTTSLKNVNVAIAKYDLYKEQIAEDNDYINESVLANLDEKTAATYTLRYGVRVNSELEADILASLTSSISSSLSSKILSKDSISEIKKQSKLDIEDKYLTELISFSATTANTIVVNTRANNETDAKLLSDIIKEKIDESLKDIAKVYTDYDLKISYTDQLLKTENYKALALSAKNGKLSDITSINATIAKLKTDLTSTEQTAYTSIINAREFCKNSNEEEFNEVYEYKSSYISLKYAVIGGLLGGILICCYYVCIYMFSGKLRTYNELSSTFRLIDLKDLENIKKLLSKYKYKHPIVLGEANEELALNGKIENADIAIISVKVDETKYSDLKEYLSQCKLYNVPILGYIKKD